MIIKLVFLFKLNASIFAKYARQTESWNILEPFYIPRFLESYYDTVYVAAYGHLLKCYDNLVQMPLSKRKCMELVLSPSIMSPKLNLLGGWTRTMDGLTSRFLHLCSMVHPRLQSFWHHVTLNPCPYAVSIMWCSVMCICLPIKIFGIRTQLLKGVVKYQLWLRNT